MRTLPQTYYDHEAEAPAYFGGTGSAHSTDSGYKGDPVVVRARPIGFLANIDQRPVYRVPARTRKVPA